MYTYKLSDFSHVLYHTPCAVYMKTTWLYYDYDHLFVSFVEWHEPVRRKERTAEKTTHNEQENDAYQPL